MTTRLEFAAGDVTELIPPPGSRSTIFIPHVANDVGRWGAGFTRSLDRRWPMVRRDYLGLWSLWREEGRIPRGGLLNLRGTARDIFNKG